MSTSHESDLIFDTTIPYVDFNFRKYSHLATLPGIVFAQLMEEVDRFLFFLRTAYHFFHPFKEHTINSFLRQLEDQDDPSLDEHFRELLDWNERERLVAETLLTRIVNSYKLYLVEIGIHINRRANSEFFDNDSPPLRNFSQIRKTYREVFRVPLYLSAREERMAVQIITLRNLIVHDIGFVPDRYLGRFENWSEFECIREDGGLLFFGMNLRCLERFGNFLCQSVAHVDARLAREFELERYTFDDSDIPQDQGSRIDVLDDDLL